MFKNRFKYYKSKLKQPDYADVLDVKNINFPLQTKIVLREPFVNCAPSNNDVENLGLKSVNTWIIFEFTEKPGLLLITNPFTPPGQRYWAARCLADYTRPPQRLNLHAHGDIGPGEEWWPTANRSEAEPRDLLGKLRWATIGYHHNWDTKVYSEANRDAMPGDLAMLCNAVASVAGGWHQFRAEAAIINYYRMDSTLSGHTDHSEHNTSAPLISISLGQSCIFLIGGETLNEDPLALWLHSGDVVIMAGESRLSYHGVPRIVTAASAPWSLVRDTSWGKTSGGCGATGDGDRTSRDLTNGKGRISCATAISEIEGNTFCDTPGWSDREVEPGFPFDKVLYFECFDDSFWSPFEHYLKTARININVRQVLFPEQKTFSS